MNERAVFSVLVRNHSGVLVRIAGLFSRRGYNIDSLTVGETEDPTFSRMTIIVRGDKAVFEQIFKQLDKLFDVVHIERLDNDSSISRELILVKVSADDTQRSAVKELVDMFKVKIVDIAEHSVIIEAIGDQQKIESILAALKPHGIKEIVRTGLTGIERGGRTLIEINKEKEVLYEEIDL